MAYIDCGLGVLYRSRKGIVLIVVALGFAHPQTAPAQTRASDEGPIQTIAFQAGYFDKDSKPIRDLSLPRTLLVQLPLIAGNIFGKPTTEQIVSLTVRIGEITRLEIERMRAAVEQSAANLTGEASKAGLIVSPRETRIARLAIFAYFPDTAKAFGPAVFQSDAPSANLIVVYFDRPCKLTGALHNHGLEAKYNVEIATAGFHFLKIVQETPSSYRVTRSSMPRRISLSIVPVYDAHK